MFHKTMDCGRANSCPANSARQIMIDRGMVWPCDERGTVNTEGRNEVKNEGKATSRNTKTKVARQHRQPPERKEHNLQKKTRSKMS